MLLARLARVKRKILRGNRSLWKTFTLRAYATRSDRGKNKKQQGVGGDVQVEIDHAVNQQPDTADKGPGVQGPRRRIVCPAQVRKSPPYQESNKSQHAQPTDQSGLGQKFQIVVVSVVDDKTVVITFIPWKYRLQSSQSCASPGMAADDPPGV